MEKGPVHAEELPVPRRPAEDPPEDIAPPLVAGQDAVADQEGHGAAVVGDDADGNVVLFVFPVGPAADLFDDDG